MTPVVKRPVAVVRVFAQQLGVGILTRQQEVHEAIVEHLERFFRGRVPWPDGGDDLFNGDDLFLARVGAFPVGGQLLEVSQDEHVRHLLGGRQAHEVEVEPGEAARPWSTIRW